MSLAARIDTPVRADRPVSEVLRSIGRAATLALYHELALAPKPGLVSFQDNGSHEDMDASTFMRSLFALRSYFPAIASAGAEGASFAVLERMGLQAEERMLAATEGINTHRGAIFALGLLCAAAGRVAAQREPLSPASLRATLRERWGDALQERAARAAAGPATSKGQRAARRHGLRGAGQEAADGFPVLFDVTLPTLRAARASAAPAAASMVQALLATVASLDDTNLAHRGGVEGLRFAQSEASAFLAADGVLRAGWRERARAMHQAFIARRLSPGGAADLLACAWWVDHLTVASRSAS
jgi:triphosphoribosyl-dephospho-CoA synthase